MGKRQGKNVQQLLRAAEVLADTLNFSRAARVLRIAQPTLTKRISGLEQWVGNPLFDRGHQGIAVNQAGQAFVEHAKIALWHTDLAVQAARAAAQSSSETLHIGRSPHIDPFLITLLLNVRLPLHPRMRIDISSHAPSALLQMVLSGQIDFAVLPDPSISPRLCALPLSEERLHVAMPSDMPSAKKRRVGIKDLDGKEWVIFERDMNPGLYDTIFRMAEETMIAPLKVHHVISFAEVLPLLATGRCIAFVNKIEALRIAWDAIAVRPLTEAQLTTKSFIVGRSDNRSKIGSEFLRTYVREFGRFAPQEQLSLAM